MLRLTTDVNRVARRRTLTGAALENLLAPIAESAAQLLIRGDPSRVGQCDHPECALYFYDETRNRSRRWCSMRTCGNRAKLAAHYRRAKQRRS